MGRKQQEEANSNSGLHNTMASGTIMKGTVNTETDFRLDGCIEGDVTSKGKLVVGPKGKIVGNVIADNAEILGIVEGTIQVSAKLSLKSTAIIKGNISAQSLEIEPNAQFDGICAMTNGAETTT